MHIVLHCNGGLPSYKVTDKKLLITMDPMTSLMLKGSALITEKHSAFVTKNHGIKTIEHKTIKDTQHNIIKNEEVYIQQVSQTHK